MCLPNGGIYMNKRYLLKKIAASFLAVTVVAGTMSFIGWNTDTADAAIYKEISGLGVSGIANPEEPDSVRAEWIGDYVYLGEYNGKAVKYRVLDVNTTEYSAQEGGVKAPTMLLESTEELWIDKFDDRGREWAESYIKVFLNSEDGYSDTGFLTSAFSGVEKNAIASSVKSTASDEDGEGMSLAGYAPLTGEKIFCLMQKKRPEQDMGTAIQTNLQ